ncbi:unnamed protein product [Adineta steineri]|uniref:Uncharacterized protein n=1 Tax=Adineta steineri TaxID=433720 RepID=A0A813WI75_9BILA|nr:unnamed protein product [Adineta steineri]CAF3515176.1 unnamed protein product [Adineta steineri]
MFAQPTGINNMLAQPIGVNNMLAQPIGINNMNAINTMNTANTWNNDYQTVGYGNYGYGIYTQDVELSRNPFTGRINLEHEIDFVPLGNQFQPYTGFPASIHQHYIN